MKKTNAVWLGLLCLAGLSLSACAADGTMGQYGATSTPYPPPGYVHYVSDGRVELYYNCSPVPGIQRVDGLAFNPWKNQPIGNLEFELDGVNARGRTVSEATMIAKNYKLFPHESTPIELELKTVGSEERLDLYYMYQFQEDDMLSMKAAWFADQPLTQWPFRSFVRDACSPTLHLTPRGGTGQFGTPPSS